jgi:hypothetical protein
VSQFRYLGKTVTNQNLVEEIRRRLTSGNAYYHSVQNILSCLLLKNVKIRICKTIVLPVVLYGSLTAKEEHTHVLSVFENRMLRRIFGPKSMR